MFETANQNIREPQNVAQGKIVEPTQDKPSNKTTYCAIANKHIANKGRDTHSNKRESALIKDITHKQKENNTQFDAITQKESRPTEYRYNFEIYENIDRNYSNSPNTSKAEVTIAENRYNPLIGEICKNSKDTENYTRYKVVESATHDNETLVAYQIINKRPDTETQRFTDIDWATGVYVIVLIIAAYARVAFGKFFQPILQSAFIYNLSVRVFNEKNLVLNRLSIILNILFFITLPAFITLLFDYYGYSLYALPVWQHYFLFLLILIVLLVARRVLNILLSTTLGLSDVMSEYIYQDNLFIKLSTPVILPFVLLLPYISENMTEFLFIMIIGLLAIIYILRVGRLFSVTNRKGFSIFYLILYLCSVEIGPGLILYKLAGQLT